MSSGASLPVSTARAGLGQPPVGSSAARFSSASGSALPSRRWVQASHRSL